MRFKIGDICDINKSSLKKNHNLDFIDYLDTGNITEGRVDEIKKIVLAEEKIPSRAKRIVKENDIIISTVRPNQKHYGIIKNPIENLIVSTGFVVLSPKKEVNADYLYNYLTLPNITEYLQGIAETSTTAYPSITPSVISDLEIELPSLVEQKAIADILSSLDEKIELNNQMNQTLEEMAQALFKRWFVDFEFPNEEGQPYKSSGGEMVESELGMIPKGWQVKSLDSSIIFQNGYAFKSKDLLDKPQENCYHVFKMGHIVKGGGLNKLGTKSYICKSECDNLGKFVLKKGDLLMCMTDMKNNVALLGHTALMDEDNKYILNQRVGLIRVKNPELINYPYLYMLTNSRIFIDELRSRANSGVQVNLSTKEIKESLFVCPNKLIHEKFNNLVEIIFEKKFSIGYENECLRNLRDTLLPKLMSGEIRVSDLN